jgi:hypothetical protein
MKRFLIAFLLFFPAISYAAISHDTSESFGYVTSTDTLTHAYTVSGTDTALVVFVDENESMYSPGVTSVTYNGVSMTEVPDSPMASQGRFWHVYVLIGADVGTHDVVIHADSALPYIQAQATSYNGVAQTGNPEVFESCSASSVTSLTCSLTVGAENSWVVGAIRGAGSDITGLYGTVIRQTPLSISNFDSGTGIPSSGTTNFGESWTGASSPGIMVFSLAPAIDGGAGGDGGGDPPMDTGSPLSTQEAKDNVLIMLGYAILWIAGFGGGYWLVTRII